MLLNIIINFLASICVAVPVFNFLPHKLSYKLQVIFTVILFLLYLLFYQRLGAYINIFAIPVFILLITLFNKKYKLINYMMGIIGYLFTVVINNLIVGTLLRIGVNLFEADLSLSFAFQIAYFIFMSIITYLISIQIVKKIIIFENFYKLCTSNLKKLLLAFPVTLIFFFYLYCIIKESTSNHQYKIIVMNSFLMSVLFFFLVLSINILMLYIYKKTKKYEENISKISKIAKEINNFDNETISKLKEIIEKEEDTKIKIVLSDLINENSKNFKDN